MSKQHWETLLCQVCDLSLICKEHSCCRGWSQQKSLSLAGSSTTRPSSMLCIDFLRCTRLCYLAAGSAPPHPASALTVASAIESLAHSRHLLRSKLVLVANEGAWWTHDEAYARAAAVSRAWWREVNQPWKQKMLQSSCLIWRETAPANFNTSNGTYPQQLRGCALGDSKSTVQPCGVQHHHCSPGTDETPWASINTMLNRSGIPVLYIWSASQALWQQHVGKRVAKLSRDGALGGKLDCVHYCTPGPIDLWVQPLLEHVAIYCPWHKFG